MKPCAAYRRAMILFEELLRQRPDDPAVRDGLAVALTHLGLARSLQRDGSDEAGQHLGHARDILQKARRRKPRLTPVPVQVGRAPPANCTACTSAIPIGRPRHSSRHRTRWTFTKELLERVPHSPRYQHQIGLIHSVRGMHFARMERREDAIREEQQARRVLLDVVRDNPGVERYQKAPGLVLR